MYPSIYKKNLYAKFNLICYLYWFNDDKTGEESYDKTCQPPKQMLTLVLMGRRGVDSIQIFKRIIFTDKTIHF